MKNKSDLPDGWSMPPDMAKRLSEGVNMKSESPEEKLQKALDEMARDIAMIEPNPIDWEWWVAYLLDEMEIEAGKRNKQEQYNKMINAFKQGLESHSRR